MDENLLREPVSRPGEPTSAPPGSATKIQVLTERASRREALFHPKDNLKRAFPVQDEDLELDGELDDAWEHELAR
jgi:hypothetical protein